jgi:hypothetical protein
VWTCPAIKAVFAIACPQATENATSSLNNKRKGQTIEDKR